MADVEVLLPSGQIEDAAKVLAKGDNIPKVLEEKSVVSSKENSETKAPPSTPTKEKEGTETEVDIENDQGDSKSPKKKTEHYPHFPRFRVTWDSTIPSLMSLKSPGKKKRRTSQSSMAERPSVHMVQEMSAQSALVEFIVTSASYHGVRRQNLTALEDELFRVFRNNVMPANAAAWYMAKRRFYSTKLPENNAQQNQLLPLLLKEYPKKFALKNNVVQFLESYHPNVAKMKMKYLVEQGLYAYFSHKVDQYGVYFFDPLYYEETEPFHANLRMVTNIYNNQKIKLVPAFFKKYKKQFHYQPLSPFLAAVSKVETEVVTGVTGVIATMFDKKFGLIRFNRNSESCLALFSANALYQNGYKLNADPKTLPPVFFDAYKIPEADRPERFKWFAVLTWIGRRPNPKFASTKEELTQCIQYKMSTSHQNDIASNPKKGQDEVDYMKMGIVKEIRKNGAVAVVKEEGEEKEQSYFIPGWSFSHLNTPRTKFLTTTQGVGLSIGDLVNFYIDNNMFAKPYDAVACNVDVLKHAEIKKKARKRSTSKGSPPVFWKTFLLQSEVDPEQASEGDPDWLPPENYVDTTDAESDISDDEIKDLADSLTKDLLIKDILPTEEIIEKVVPEESEKPAAVQV